MGKVTKIEWTATQAPDGSWIPGATFSPWHGCLKVSAGCTNCYAETLSKRFGRDVWGPAKDITDRHFFGEKHWEEPRKWNYVAGKAGIIRKVFCGSMCDVFEDAEIYTASGSNVLDSERRKLWQLVKDTPHLIWLFSTKRPENMIRMTPDEWREKWPDNTWAITTTENQEEADKRIPELLKVPSKVHGLSCEPLLGTLNLSDYLSQNGKVFHKGGYTDAVNWVIAGGESGANARPMNIAWARSLRDQCQATSTAFNFKQYGEWAPVHEDTPLPLSEAKKLRAMGKDGEILGTNDSTADAAAWIWRAGKAVAGRMLDGRTWDESPAV